MATSTGVRVKISTRMPSRATSTTAWASAYEINRTDLWLLRHHQDPAPLAGWLLLDAPRHLPGPMAFSDREALSWGQAVRYASHLVQRITGCDRVYSLAFGQGTPHLHLHLIPRHRLDPMPAAWSMADLYRAVAKGRRQAADPQLVRELMARDRELMEMSQLEKPATAFP